MADRIAVMYAGKIVEYGGARQILPAQPPYTWGLLGAMPNLIQDVKSESRPPFPARRPICMPRPRVRLCGPVTYAMGACLKEDPRSLSAARATAPLLAAGPKSPLMLTPPEGIPPLPKAREQPCLT